MIDADINKILVNVLTDGDISLSNTEKLLDMVIDEIYIKNQYDLVSISTQELAKKIIDIIRSQPNIVRENFRILHLLFSLSILLRVAPVDTIRDQYCYLLAKFLNLDEFSKQYRLVARSTSFKNFAIRTAKYFFDDEFYHKMELKDQERSICMYFYASTAYSGSSKDHMENMYPELYKVFLKAIELKQCDLVFYLYTPLLYSYNSLATTQKEFKYFNDKVESKLSEYIKTVMIPFYNLKPNNKINKKDNNKIKIAFIQERIFKYSINEVFKSLLKELKNNSSSQYEFKILDINFAELPSSSKEVEKIKEFGFKYVDLHKNFVGEKIPFYSTVSKAIAMREYIIDEAFDIVIGGNGRPEFNFLFTTRTAPTQIFWSHGNAAYDVDGIDKRISHFPQTSKFRFDIFNIPIDKKKYNPTVDMSVVKQIRESYPNDVTILGAIGRLIKLDSQEYLETVAKIMTQNPKTIFLACGAGDTAEIIKKIDKLGIKDKFYFTGQINSHLYGHVIDLFLSPFPSGGGEALDEYRYKGKPYVVILDNNINIKGEQEIDKLINDIKNNNLIEFDSSLYNKEDFNSLKRNNFINNINKQAQSFMTIPFAKNKESYIDIANEFIKNKKLRENAGVEFLYYTKNKHLENNFLEVVD